MYQEIFLYIKPVLYVFESKINKERKKKIKNKSEQESLLFK